MTEPRSSYMKSVDEHSHSGARDAQSDFEAQTNQAIIEKYQTLKSLKQQMTKTKQDFNETVLKLQEEKQEKCAILSEKIEMFRGICEKLHANHDNLIDVKEHTDKFIQFDGKSFKVAS